jgi:hypothetical protein
LIQSAHEAIKYEEWFNKLLSIEVKGNCGYVIVIIHKLSPRICHRPMMIEGGIATGL